MELSDIDLTYNGDEKEKITSECYNVQPRITSVTKALACATMGDIPPEGDTPPSPTEASDDPSAPGTMTNGYYPHTLPRPYGASGPTSSAAGNILQKISTVKLVVFSAFVLCLVLFILALWWCRG